MRELIEVAEASGGGLVLAARLAALGLNSRHIRRAVEAGLLVRIARGVYARPPGSRPFRPDELHSLRVRGAAALHSRDAVVSHLSAAALHGLPLIGPWPSRVEVSVAGAAGGSSSAGIRRHTPAEPPDETVLDGVRVTSLARTLVDVACTSSMLVGVTMIDAALHSDRVTKDALVEQLARAPQRTGLRRALQSVEFADRRAESPGESLTRVRAWQLGFEAPDLQVAVSTRIGSFVVDFGWAACALFGEFDGAVKYTRAEFMRRRSIDAVVGDEKRREDAIRAATGRRFIRITWAEALSAPILHGILGAAGVARRLR